MAEALDAIRERYVAPVDSKKLAYEAIRGMVKELDRYSEFYGPDEKTVFQEETEGEFGGLGVVLDWSQEGPGVLVSYPIHKSPADRQGIRAGDRILGADGEPIGEVRTDEERTRLLKRLKGKVGTSVRLVVQSPGADPREVTVVRERIHVNSIRGPAVLDRERGVGYVRIRGFQEHTSRDFQAAFRWLEGQGAAKALVLDLRYNNGGLLKSAVEIADQFLSGGLIVTTRGRDPLSQVEYRASASTRVSPDLTLIVLVNGHSASAAEVVAGALQDHRRAILVGTRTFGKGVVQTPIYLDSDRALLKITTARYYTPSGRCIEKRVGVDDDRRGVGGILPDVSVPLTREESRALHAELERQRALEDLLANGEPAEPEDASVRDRPLETALAILRGEPATQLVVERPAGTPAATLDTALAPSTIDGLPDGEEDER